MRYLLIFLILLLNTKLTFAEPSPIVSRLMNEPLSMLDYGLWRTELELKKYFIEVDKVFVGSRYDWQQNRIMIDVLFYSIPERLQKLTPHKQCLDILASIRDFFGVDNSTGKPTTGLDYTLLGKSFTHNGFKGMDIPQDALFKHLDNITMINVSLTEKSANPEKLNMHSCDSPLLGAANN